MKSTIEFITVLFLLLLLTLSAGAQTFPPTTFTLSTNAMPVKSTNAVASAPVFIGSTPYVVLGAVTVGSTNLAGIAANSNMVFTVQGSLDNSAWYDGSTNYQITAGLTRGGTNNAYSVLDTRAFQWLRVSSMTNPSTNTVATPTLTIWPLK